MKFSVTILCLAGTCAVAAPLCLAASHYATVAELIYALTGIGVAGCIAAAFVRRGQAKAWWTGCSLFAAVYFVTAVQADSLWNLAVQILRTQSAARPQIVTSYWLVWLFDHTGAPEIWTGGGSRVPAAKLLQIAPRFVPNSLDLDAYHAFLLTGHCIYTWSAGLVGGIIGMAFYRAEKIEKTADKSGSD